MHIAAWHRVFERLSLMTFVQALTALVMHLLSGFPCHGFHVELECTRSNSGVRLRLHPAPVSIARACGYRRQGTVPDKHWKSAP